MINEQVVAPKGRRTAAEIEQIVGEYQSSGLNRSQFCRHRGLTFGVLNHYLKRMRAASDGGATGDGLVAVEWAGKKLGAERAGVYPYLSAPQHLVILTSSQVSLNCTRHRANRAACNTALSN